MQGRNIHVLGLLVLCVVCATRLLRSSGETDRPSFVCGSHSFHASCSRSETRTINSRDSVPTENGS